MLEPRSPENELTDKPGQAKLSEKAGIMSSKRFGSPGVMILLLAIALLGGGCTTTSSQAAKSHQPQMITGEEEREAAFKLPDGVADVLSFLGQLASGLAPSSW